MSDSAPQSPESQPVIPRYETDENAGKTFHGWRLIGIIVSVAVVLALVSFIVDWVVIGPIEGRVF